MNLEIEEGRMLIEQAIKAKEHERIEMRWLIGGYEKIYSLDDFKKSIYKPVTAPQSKEAILNQLEILFGGE